MDALTCASGQNAHNPLRNIFDIRRAPAHIFVLHRRKHLGEIVTGHRNRILGIDLLRIDDILNRVQIVLILQHDLVNLENRRIRLANFFYRLFIQLAELADGLLNCRIKPRFFLLCILYFCPFYGLLAFLIHTYFSNCDTAKYTFSTIRLHDHSPFH